MTRALLTLFTAGLILAASGCAGHKELKSPCTVSSEGKTAPWLSSLAYAGEADCGPLIRQDGVSAL